MPFGQVIKTPNLAEQKDTGSFCSAVTESTMGSNMVMKVGSNVMMKVCPNQARWLLTDDNGKTHPVCLMHANKARKTGELTVVHPGYTAPNRRRSR